MRERVREAGGWWNWVNSSLVRYAGPAAVGPFDTDAAPTSTERAERSCPLCRQPMNAHTFDRSGEKPLMFCP